MAGALGPTVVEILLGRTPLVSVIQTARLLELQQPCQPTAPDADPENLYPRTNEDGFLW
jgi:hypothetical protein